MNGKLVHIKPIGNQSKDEPKEGKFYDKPKAGQVFAIGVHTIKVIRLLDNNQFETEYGTYQLLLW